MTEHHEHQHSMSYEDAIEQFRADKDAYFRSGAGSPVPAADRDGFTGIPYFPVDARWIVDELALEPAPTSNVTRPSPTSNCSSNGSATNPRRGNAANSKRHARDAACITGAEHRA